MNRHTILIVGIVVVGIALLGMIFSATLLRVSDGAPVQVACTMEAKLCPDGSSVGRSGPSCEFAACPGEGAVIPSETTLPPASGGTTGGGASSGITGSVTLGPTCPVMRDPPDPQCADKSFSTNLVVVRSDGAQVVKTFSSDSNGKFIVQVPPGTYVIKSAGTSMYPRCGTRSSSTVRVSAASYTDVMISCDTGIR